MDFFRNNLRELIEYKIEVVRAVPIEEATPEDIYFALASVAKDLITRDYVRTSKINNTEHKKQVYYFSIEFLLGKMMKRNLIALGIKDECEQALRDMGVDPDDIYNVEADAGLGNGGLGRLAACFVDSMSALGMAGNGCSIRYKYGLFEQKIINGEQLEFPDNWLKIENPWEIKKSGEEKEIHFFGDVRQERIDGKLHFIHEGYETVIAVPYDIPIPGYQNDKVNTLRLWSAESSQQMIFKTFAEGEHIEAVTPRYSAEAISEVLYPDDSNYENRLLRLKQQYFFVSAGLQSIVENYKEHYPYGLRQMHKYISVHINDTHPAIAVPELMRILIDQEGLGWEDAWEVTVGTISYTNHTIMPEALERWPIDIFRNLLPRVYMIVHEINERFCEDLWSLFPGEWDKISRMSIEADGLIRMAYLAIVGSHSINGVAAVHSQILKDELFHDFYEIYPERFGNKTNGITHRRWLIQSNPRLTELISDSIGDGWTRRPKELIRLREEGFTRNSDFLHQMRHIKRANKKELAAIIKSSCNITVDPESMFDVQVKRIHTYKRQHLNALRILDEYFMLLDNPNMEYTPRTYIFGGKAAPGFYYAKQMIRLINSIADKINGDKRMQDKMHVVFLENYRVSLAEKIFPASDLSEQISTASMEASGTGNMKFMINGAITMGTEDGANIEIMNAVGRENIITFGLKVPDVLRLQKEGTYRASEVYDSEPRVHRVVEALVDGSLRGGGQEFFNEIYRSLTLYNDEYFLLADFMSYIEAQKKASALYRDKEKWSRMSAENIACSGVFSSDEVIKQYAEDIWGVKTDY